MKSIFATLQMLTVVLSLAGNQAHACSPANPPAFTSFADTAPRVFVAKVVSMRLIQEPITYEDGHHGELVGVESEINIEKNLRGNADQFKKMRYINWGCAGSDIKLGHLYLVATEQAGELLELNFKTVAIGDITPGDTIAINGPFDTDVASNEFVVEAERGLRESGNFSGTFLDHLSHPIPTLRPVEVWIEIPKIKRTSRSKKNSTAVNASPL